MKYAIITALAALSMTGCASGSYDAFSVPRSSSLATAQRYASTVAEFLKTGTPEQAIANAQAAVASLLKDPGSAQFRNVRINAYGDGKVICGEVNAKNSYGGYVGFSPFMASTNAGTLYSNEKWDELRAAINAGINAAC